LALRAGPATAQGRYLQTATATTLHQIDAGSATTMRDKLRQKIGAAISRGDRRRDPDGSAA
jgi:hypothetical protein